MPADDNSPYTYNELSNEDKQLLLSHGYRPGELDPEDERELLRDLRQDSDSDDRDSDSEATIADEKDGTDSV